MHSTSMEPYTIDPETQWPNSLKVLDQLNSFRVAVKHVNSQPIHAFFIIPKKLPPGPRPLLVRIHGGGWTEGEAEASLRPFFLELALKHGAVIVSPDYRLRPEHDVADGIEDIRSFWKWIENSMQQVVHQTLPNLHIDVNNLLVGGESGGGYHTVQTALLGMTSLPIKVLFLQYPALDLESMFEVPDMIGLGNGVSDTLYGEVVPYSIVEEYLQSVPRGRICARAKYGSRMHLMKALVQAKKFCDVAGDRAWISPLRSLETAGKLPPILLYHSKEDEGIPWQQTETWAKKLTALQPAVPLFLKYHIGDHVFDADHTMKEPWLKEPLQFVQSYWPA